MQEIAIAIAIAQVAVVAFVLWPAFRMMRKAGYQDRQAWIVVASSVLLAVAGMATNFALAAAGWFSYCAPLGVRGMVLVGLVSFGSSPFTLSALPVLYLSLRVRPANIDASDLDAFG